MPSSERIDVRRKPMRRPPKTSSRRATDRAGASDSPLELSFRHCSGWHLLGLALARAGTCSGYLLGPSLFERRIVIQVAFGDDRESLFVERIHRHLDILNHDRDRWFSVWPNDQGIRLNDV